MPKNVNLYWIPPKWFSTFQTEWPSKLLDRSTTRPSHCKFLKLPFETFMELQRVKDPIKILMNLEYYFAHFKMPDSQDMGKPKSQHVLVLEKRRCAVHRWRHLLSKDLKQTRQKKTRRHTKSSSISRVGLVT